MANVNDVKTRVKTITLNDGVEREIKFTLNAMAEIEDKYGSVDAGFAKLDEGSIKAARFIMWAGLLHNEENLTEQQVGNLIDMDCLNEIFEQMNGALKEDMPQKDSNEAIKELPNA
jgi:hypothetical protein